MSDSTHLLTAREAAERIAAGALTSAQYVRVCLERIELRENQVGAWEQLDPDKALKRARGLDSLDTRGPLHGLPVGIKDVFDTYDFPTAYGSPIYRDHHPSRDAACVALIREAGGIVAGKTVTNEFAYFTPGKTTNPYNSEHTPGGSSSGSAAAVADYMVPLAIGTQTAGSIIRPAAFCGVVGYKPTFGAINRSGVLNFAESLDTIGVFARNVTDATLLAVVLAPQLKLVDNRHPVNTPRFGLCRTASWDKASRETTENLNTVASLLANSGAHIEEHELPTSFANLLDVHATIMAFEASRSFSFERCQHRGELSPHFLELLIKGERCSPSAYESACNEARRLRERLSLVFGGVDALLTPSTIGEATRGLDTTGDPLFNKVWTLLHAPCVHIPSGLGPQGLPLGIQVVALRGRDVHLLRVAEWIETQLAVGREQEAAAASSTQVSQTTDRGA